MSYETDCYAAPLASRLDKGQKGTCTASILALDFTQHRLDIPVEEGEGCCM